MNKANYHISSDAIDVSHKNQIVPRRPNFILMASLIVGLHTMQLNLFTTKQCTKCGEAKLLNEFRKHRNQCKDCERDYRKQYYEIHREELKTYTKQYLQEHREVVKRWEQEHKEERKAYKKRYYEIYKDKFNARSKQHYQKHKGKTLEHKKQYRQTSQGKIAHNKSSAKRYRNLGFNLLNEAFKGSVWHHINNNDVVAIPEEIHLAHFTGETKRHRDLILSHYGNLKNMLKKGG